MKTLKKSIFAVIVVGLLMAMLCVAFSITVKAHAEEVEDVQVVEVDETESKVDALIGKVNGYLDTANSVWNTRILPILLSFGSTFISAIGIVALTIGKIKKWKEKYSIVATTANEYEKQLNELKAKIDNNETVKEVRAELESTKAELKASIGEVKALTEQIKNGALQAWVESPDAIRKLTE